MSDSKWERVKEVFNSALEVAPAERESYLAAACAGDETLRREVESLIALEGEADNFIETPALEDGLRLVHDSLNPATLSRRIGNYEIIKELGRGRMGAVYLATRADDQYKKQVAIKLVQQGAQNDFIIRHFLSERQILADLDHPNIARLLDGGATEDGSPYLVMEYVEGLPIDKYSDERNLSIAERLRLFRAVCSAVQYAHRNLVIHRDIKPSNILVTAGGKPKLLDFGIAKLLAPTSQAHETTASFIRLMTPAYASPEQARGGPVTTASDVYTLGVVLYELLTGRRPYRVDTTSPLEAVRIICEQEPERPSTAAGRISADTDANLERQTEGARATPEAINKLRKSQPERLRRELAGDLDNIVLKAIRKEPEHRYASVEQFSEDIRRHLEGLPVIARADSFGYRAAKFILRHKAGVAASALILLSLIAGLIATFWQARVARAERDRAAQAQAKAEHINSFMQEALGSADPTKEGREVKVIDVLEKAARRAETELADQPEVLAEVRRTIGRTYYNLELYDKGEPLLRAALYTYQEIFGEAHPTTALCMKELGDLLAYQEKFDEAIQLLQKSVATYSRLPAEDRRLAANAKYSLAQAFYFKGDTRAAEPLYREILDFAQKNLGGGDTLVAEASNDLANILRESDYEEAIALYRQAIKIVRPLPEKRMDLATCSSNLGVALMNAGRYEEAEAPLRESLLIRREIFGENSPSTALVLVHLSRVHFSRGDYAQAEAEARQAIAVQEKRLPKGHRNLAPAYVALGRALTKNGKLKEAEKYLRDGLDLYVKKTGAGDRHSATAEGSLGECLTLQRRYVEAEALLKRSYGAPRTKLGEKDPATMEALKRLVALYEALGKKDEVARYQAMLPSG